jgi:hypothetical protein
MGDDYLLDICSELMKFVYRHPRGIVRYRRVAGKFVAGDSGSMGSAAMNGARVIDKQRGVVAVEWTRESEPL